MESKDLWILQHRSCKTFHYQTEIVSTFDTVLHIVLLHLIHMHSYMLEQSQGKVKDMENFIAHDIT